MKHITLYISLVIIMFSSCEIYKTVDKTLEQEVKFHFNSPQKFIVENNQIIINIKVNGKQGKMYFDTGSADVIFTDAGKLTDTLTVISSPNLSPKGSANNKLDRVYVKIQKADCELFSITDWVINGIDFNRKCDNKIGFIGYTQFDYNKKILKMDFDNKQLTVIEEIPSDWQIIKSKFSLGGYIKILLKINDKYIPFIFDTGYNGSLLVSQKNTNKNLKSCETLYTISGNLIQTMGGEIINGEEEIKNIDKVGLNDTEFLTNIELDIVPDIINNLVGIEFLQNYNWIFDYENKNVYFQKRKTSVDKEEKFYMKNFAAYFDYSVTPVETIGIIKGASVEDKGLQLGDKIISVNSLNLSEIPTCEREELLKKEVNNSKNVKITIERNGKTKILEI